MFHLAARVVGFFVHWRVSEATFPASALFASASLGDLERPESAPIVR
jgi:hypothetical protein